MNWCILRTAASRTIPLAAALNAAGYIAWTPQETRRIRVGPQRKVKDVGAAMTPTIVFAEYDRLPELVAISRLPPSRSMGLPGFSVFRYLDSYPRIADRALDALRLAEHRAKPRSQVRTFQNGELVSLPACGFEGLVGTVAGTRGRYTLVSFPGFRMPVQIDLHNLLPHVEAA